MSQPEFEEINDSEKEWIATQVQNAGFLMSDLFPDDGEDLPSLNRMDQVWSSWLQSGTKDGNAIKVLIDAIGTAFGSHLVENGGFTWTIATDEYGTGLAVRALPGRGDVVVYPADFVAKRWERREENFLEDGYRFILNHVEDMRNRWDDAER